MVSVSVPDLHFGNQTFKGLLSLSLSTLAFTGVLGVLLYFVLAHMHSGEDVFEPANEEQKKLNRKGRWIYFVGPIVYASMLLWDSKSTSEAFARLASACVGVGLMALILWFAFGRWLHARLANRRNSQEGLVV